MTGKYAAEHASAYTDVAEAGAPVTFTPPTTGTFTPGTGVIAPTTATPIDGVAMRVRGNPLRYQALGLIEAQAISVMFVATTYGDQPALGMTFTFGGVEYSVKDVNPLAPDGVPISTRVIGGIA